MKTPSKTLAATLFAGLVLAATTASARGPVGEIDDGQRFAIGELRGPLTGSIEVTNERNRLVQLYVDGRFALEIAPRSTAVLPDVPNGIRLVAYGDRDHRFQVDKVEVRVDRRSSLRIASLRGIALIKNDSGIAMRVVFGDSDLGTLQPGQDISSPPLMEGTYTLTYQPRDAHGIPARNERVSIQAGETARVSLAPFFAALTVRNPFPFDVSLFLDGQRIAKLDRFAELRLDTLRPGHVAAELRAKHNKVMVANVVDLDAGRMTRWEPQVARYGDIQVVNPGRFPVRIQMGGMTGFRLGAGESRFFSNLDAGRIDIQVTLDDGRVVMHAAEIRAGERAVFEVPAGGWAPSHPVPVRPDQNPY